MFTVCWWARGLDVALLILLLLPVLNFINIAERRSFSATLQASGVQTTRYDN